MKILNTLTPARQTWKMLACRTSTALSVVALCTTIVRGQTTLRVPAADPPPCAEKDCPATGATPGYDIPANTRAANLNDATTTLRSENPPGNLKIGRDNQSEREPNGEGFRSP